MHENKNIKKLKPYKLSTHKAWENIDDGDVLKLDWNEATCSASPGVIERVSHFIKNGRLNWYPDVANNELLEKLAKYVGISKEKIQYFGSSDYLQEYISTCYLDQDDIVLILGPTYDNFRVTAESVGSKVKFFYLDENFKFNHEAFIKHLNEINPKFVYICNPNNPTGTLIKKNTIKNLLMLFPDTMFLIDEAYYEFAGESCASLVNNFNNILISRTFSKAFAIASFRIGYAVSAEQNIINLSKIRNSKNITQLSQIAAIAALDDIKYTKEYIEEVKSAKDVFVRFLEKYKKFGIDPIDGYGNYILIKIKNGHKIKLLSYLETKKIYVRDYGHVSGMEDCIRITIGTSEQMAYVSEEIENYLSSYI